MKTVINLRLFVTGRGATTRRAIDNLDAVRNDPAVKRRYEINVEVIDVDQSPDIAEEDKILVTPTLLKKLPLPMRRLVGDLSREEDILLTLNIEPPKAASEA